MLAGEEGQIIEETHSQEKDPLALAESDPKTYQ